MGNVRPLTAAQQHFALTSCRLVSEGAGFVRKGRLRWDCTAQPTPLSRRYRLRIEYKVREAPRVTVLAPGLAQLAEGRPLPHVYRQEPPELCLYVPESQEWSPSRLIVATLVPWAFLWLLCFEHWLATDEWLGGGSHPKVENHGCA